MSPIQLQLLAISVQLALLTGQLAMISYQIRKIWERAAPPQMCGNRIAATGTYCFRAKGHEGDCSPEIKRHG